PKCFPNIVGKNPDEEESKIEKIPVHILHNERERTLAPIALARFPYGACGWIGPERLVVCTAVVITGQPKSSGRPKNQQRRREKEPTRPPRGLRPKPAVRRIAENFRRIKWRDVIANEIILPLKRRPRGIDDECR